MARGRGIASQAVIAAIALLCMLVHCKIVDAANYTVGDSGGWTFNVANWPNGKHFRTRDILVFNYDLGFHNVAVVDKNGYDTCTTPTGAKVYQSGNDRITLVNGQNFFICSITGHCGSGMKIAVNAM